ncbi:MAG: hypothetical protein ACOCWQ_04015 [Nanoarchaeota archaeon]
MEQTGASLGEYVLQSYPSPFLSAQEAMLIAGYSRKDTIGAADILLEQLP